jgi:hypothetical protein
MLHLRELAVAEQTQGPLVVLGFPASAPRQVDVVCGVVAEVCQANGNQRPTRDLRFVTDDKLWQCRAPVPSLQATPVRPLRGSGFQARRSSAGPAVPGARGEHGPNVTG